MLTWATDALALRYTQLLMLSLQSTVLRDPTQREVWSPTFLGCPVSIFFLSLVLKALKYWHNDVTEGHV